MVNVTATLPTNGGWFTVHPADVGPPTTANLNFIAGQTVSNLVVMRVPPDADPNAGSIGIYNPYGFTHVVIDIVGWFDDVRTGDTGRFMPIAPVRAIDTRIYLNGDPIFEDSVRAVNVTQFGIKTGAGAILCNVTATLPTDYGWFTIYSPDLTEIPFAANLTFTPGLTVPNLVMVDVGHSPYGYIDIYNGPGDTHAIVDVNGYFMT